MFSTIYHSWKRVKTVGAVPCNLHACHYLPHRNSLLILRGGDGASFLSDLHLLDLKTFKWTKLKSSGHAPSRRANFGSAMVGNEVFVFGGWDGKKRLGDLFILNTSSETFEWFCPSDTGQVPSPRSGISLCAIKDQIFLFGGCLNTSKVLNDLFIFDTKTYKWRQPNQIKEEVQTLNKQNNSRLNILEAMRQSVRKKAEKEAGIKIKGFNNHENPNEGPQIGALTLFGNLPASRSNYSIERVGRKLYIFGGGSNEANGQLIYKDFHVLDTDPVPKIKQNLTNSASLIETELSKYFNNKNLSDVVFEIGKKKLYAHKLLLSLKSEKFRFLFSSSADGKKKEKKKEKYLKYKIKDWNYESFYIFLYFLYHGKISDDIVNNLMITIEKEIDEDKVEIMSNDSDEEENEDEGLSSLFKTKRDSVQEESEIESIYETMLSRSSRKEKNNEGLEFDKIIAKQTNRLSLLDLKINQETYSTFIELLYLSDYYLVPALNTLVSSLLIKTLNLDNVEELLKHGERSNSKNLVDLCQHFQRNYSDFVKQNQ